MTAILQPPGLSIASLSEVDPELTAGIPEEDQELARRVLAWPRHPIPKGEWSPGLLRGHGRGAFAILVVDGALVRQLDLAARPCIQLLGPGDVLRPAAGAGVFEFRVTWAALRPSSVVVLDERFTRASQRWPSLGLNLQRRLLDQADRAALHTAIAQLPRVEERLLAILWQLGDRWGRVTPVGVEVPLELTHETLGRLIGAQRPTVSLALRELAEGGIVTRSAGRGFVLDPDSHRALEPVVGLATTAMGH